MNWNIWRKVTLPGLIFLVMTTASASVGLAGDANFWGFANDSVGTVPQGWEVLSGRWEIQAEPPGTNRALAQVGPPLPGFALPSILAPFPPVCDLRAAVKLKLTRTGGSETMGLILRQHDPGRMMIVRVEGSPGRVWVERVQESRWSLRAGYAVSVERDRWNLLRVAAQGDWLNLFFNGRFLGGVRDDDPVPGRVGLMAGPNAGVFLDDFEVETPLTPEIPG